MADNTTLDPGSGGDIIAADEIGGVKYPRSKITLGVDGVNDGDVSASNPMPVAWAAASLQSSNSTASAVAAGGSTTFNSTEITTAKTGKLLYVRVGSSVPLKVVLSSVEGGVATTKEIGYGWQGNFEWRTPSHGYITQAYVAGTDNFRVVATNLDSTLAADISCAFAWDEVD